MSMKKKSRKKATLERRVQRSNKVVKINHPARKKPKAMSSVVPPLAVYASMIPKPGVKMIAYEIQKPPYDDRAVAPKVLPTAISLDVVTFVSFKRSERVNLPHAGKQLDEASISKS